MRAAVVNITTNIVENVIVADATKDPAYEGTILVNLPDGSPVSFGWIYNPADQTFSAPVE